MSRLSGNKAYIISYDFSNNKLRSKIHKTLKNYGLRVQCSVFRCSISKEQLDELTEKIKFLIKKFGALCNVNDSLIIIGEMSSEKIHFLVGDSCEIEDFAIY